VKIAADGESSDPPGEVFSLGRRAFASLHRPWCQFGRQRIGTAWRRPVSRMRSMSKVLSLPIFRRRAMRQIRSRLTPPRPGVDAPPVVTRPRCLATRWRSSRSGAVGDPAAPWRAPSH